jgi:hypothetical protein
MRTWPGLLAICIVGVPLIYWAHGQDFKRCVARGGVSLPFLTGYCTDASGNRVPFPKPRECD